MSNEISSALRLLADRIDNEMPDAQAMVFAIGDRTNCMKMSGYFGSIEPAHDVAIHMFANAIIEMNNKRNEDSGQ